MIGTYLHIPFVMQLTFKFELAQDKHHFKYVERQKTEVEKGQQSSWVMGRVVVHLDRLHYLENDESGAISPSSAICFLDAGQLRPLTLLFA